MQTYYIINFSSSCITLEDNNFESYLHTIPRVFLKEDGSPYFLNKLNAEFTLTCLTRKYPQHLYWLTELFVLDHASV